MTPEEELATLSQFLRFGETKSSAELMISQHRYDPLPTNIPEPTQHPLPLTTGPTAPKNPMVTGHRSPGLRLLGFFSGGKECGKASSSLPHQFSGGLSELQQDPETKPRETVEPEAASRTRPTLQQRAERKTRGEDNNVHWVNM